MRVETRCESWRLWDGKRNLKEDEVDEEEDEARAAEPEEVVAGLNQRRPLNHFTSLLDMQTHLCYDHLKLCPH